MPHDIGQNSQSEQPTTYIGSAVSSIGGAVMGAGSMVASGASYLGIWKGTSPNKQSLADQNVDLGSSYYNPPGGTYSGSDEVLRGN